MTVASTLTAKQYTSTGVNTQFAFPNKIFAAADLAVTIFDLTGAAYPFTNFANGALGLSFSVQGVDIDTGCTVVLSAPFTLNWTIDIRSLVAETQSTSIKNQGLFLPELHEEAFDRSTRQIQDLLRLAYTFGIHGPDNEVTPWPALPVPSLRKGYGLLFDGITGLPGLGFLSAQNVTLGLLAPLLGLQQTAAETAAGVTVINFFYPAMYVDRYATNTTPGVTSMAAAFTAAVKVAQKGGGTVRYGATAPYLLDAPIDCTFAGSANQWGVVIRGDSVSADGSPTQVLIAKHTGVAVFDCTGNDCIEFYDMCVRTDAVTFPKTGVLWARNTGVNSQINRMQNCRIIGNFSVACLYNYASEDDVVIGNYFYNTCTAAGTACAIWTANNINGLTSSFTAIHVGSISCIDHTVIGNQFFNQGATATADCIRLEAVESFKLYGGWAYAQSGRALIYVDQTNFASSNCVVHGLTGEFASGSLHQYGILFSNNAFTAAGWTIDSCKLTGTTFAIAAAGASPILDSFFIRNIIEGAAHGISVPGTLQNSTLHTSALLLTIGTSRNNSLTGYSEQWTITTRNNDNWTDTGVTNKTWTPALGTVAHGGVITFNEAHCLFNGNQVDVELLMTDTVSITATAAQTITGLPKAASARSAMVLFANETTGVAIGTGFIEAGTTTIKCPAFTTGAGVSVCVSARYFVA